jgi:hypothetical protein
MSSLIPAIIYLLTFGYFASKYRKLKGTDPESLAFQSKIEDRLKKSPILGSKKDFQKMMIIGMAACVWLLVITAINYSKSLK